MGAGASWHYGYPTGEQLVERVAEKAEMISRYFKHSLEFKNSEVPEYIDDKTKTGMSLDDAWKAGIAESENLKKALTQTNPLVIDYFLGWNPAIRAMGKLLIAWEILECERNWRVNPFNRNRTDPPYQDNWCRFVTHQLAIRCAKSSDLLLNDVTFVTFNYDVSLETALRQGLEHIELFSPDDVKTFFSNERFLRKKQ